VICKNFPRLGLRIVDLSRWTSPVILAAQEWPATHGSAD